MWKREISLEQKLIKITNTTTRLIELCHKHFNEKWKWKLSGGWVCYHCNQPYKVYVYSGVPQDKFKIGGENVLCNHKIDCPVLIFKNIKEDFLK